jgi:proteic killer suppression protein
MIKSFRHKGLAEFFTTGSKKGIRPEQATRLADILFRLQYATDVQDMNFPGAGLHTLRGQRAGFWAVKVSGNWRIIFRFKDGHALEVDYLDYH